MSQLSPHFTEEEFSCNHCNTLPDGGISSRLVEILEDIRAHFGGQPVTINSGYRCPTHNANVGGASNSQHLYGTASDIVVKNVSPSKVQQYVDQTYGSSVSMGYYDSFSHLDTRDPSGARWYG